LRIRVVFPEPAKPVIIVMGIRAVAMIVFEILSMVLWTCYLGISVERFTIIYFLSPETSGTIRSRSSERTCPAVFVRLFGGEPRPLDRSEPDREHGIKSAENWQKHPLPLERNRDKQENRCRKVLSIHDSTILHHSLISQKSHTSFPSGVPLFFYQALEQNTVLL
jgi:hypothetical protein